MRFLFVSLALSIAVALTYFALVLYGDVTSGGRAMGGAGGGGVEQRAALGLRGDGQGAGLSGGQSRVQTQTSDDWPRFSREYFAQPIPRSPFRPNFTITWDFDTAAFLAQPHVQGRPPKLITWEVKTRYMVPLPEPVRLRVCPEMPCRLTTNTSYSAESAARIWAGQIMRDAAPPVRTSSDQVFILHNHEPQTPDWTKLPSFRQPAWRSAFNWTMHYRFDADLVDLYGRIVRRSTPVRKNYTAIMAGKTKMAAMLVSHCPTHGRRENYVKKLQRYIRVDVYGECGPFKCPRAVDDECFRKLTGQYKFFLAFENAFCTDYISEKFFRYLEADVVVVARGSNEYKYHAPPGIFINTADFQTPKDLAKYLIYLDSRPDQYAQLLKVKDSFQPLYEDWPIRRPDGSVRYMHYHYEAVTYCEMCRRLWKVDVFRKTIPDIVRWFDRGNCYPPDDIV